MKTSRYTEAQIIRCLAGFCEANAVRGDFASGRRRCAGFRALPRAWHERCVVLQMAGQVWRNGCRAMGTPLVRVTMARVERPALVRHQR